MVDVLARRYPIAMPAIGLLLSCAASGSLLFVGSENGKLLSLIAAAGAMVNAWVLIRRLNAKRVS